MNLLAIDPGVSGGFAYYSPALRGVELVSMPPSKPEISQTLDSYVDPINTLVVIEKINGYMGRARHNCKVGVLMENYGFLQGVVQHINAKMLYVVPRTWQRALNLSRDKELAQNQWKQQIKERVGEIYPNANITLKTADALGILHYAIHNAPTKVTDTTR